jgi:hypothetical protein
MRAANNSKQSEKLYKITRIKFSHATDYRKGVLSLATDNHSTRQ